MCKLICEIGINHGGSINVAKELILHAAKSHAYGVKFQYRNMDNFYATNDEIGDEIVASELKKSELTLEQFNELHLFANSHNLSFGVSFFRQSDLSNYLEHCNTPDFIKIPSAECLNKALVLAAMELCEIVIVSTGGQVLEHVVDQYKDHHFNKLIVMHCVANYPVDDGAQNLSKIGVLKKHFVSGYSSHDTNYLNCIAAIALGAEYIERHLTLDKNGCGLDDSSSSEPAEMKTLGEFCKKFPAIMGNIEKGPNQGEKLNLQNLGTSYFAVRDITAGELLSSDAIIAKAPRKGLSVHEVDKNFIGARVENKILKNEPISKQSFKPTQNFKFNLEFANCVQIAIPVRLHDHGILKKFVPISNFEFHLSYREVLDCLDEMNLAEIKENEQYAIHLPDYIPGNRILDPLSDDPDTRQVSIRIIEKTQDFATKIKQKTAKPVPIVGSFSQKSSREDRAFLDLLNNDILRNYENRIYPQWLPVNAWYFGGTVKLDTFSNEQYIRLLKEFKIKICLDMCHLILSANFHKKNWEDWFLSLSPLAEHYHLADGSGVDNEGLFFGEGDLRKYKRILNSQGMKTIEVWQGHLNNGELFIASINKLEELNNG